MAEVNSAKGAWLEFGTFTLDAASIAAAAQGAEAVTITGLAVGDQAFINCQAPAVMEVVAGCKVTATDTLTVYLNNAYDATTAVNPALMTFDVMIVHKS